MWAGAAEHPHSTNGEGAYIQMTFLSCPELKICANEYSEQTCRHSQRYLHTIHYMWRKLPSALPLSCCDGERGRAGNGWFNEAINKNSFSANTFIFGDFSVFLFMCVSLHRFVCRGKKMGVFSEFSMNLPLHAHVVHGCSSVLSMQFKGIAFFNFFPSRQETPPCFILSLS